MLSCSTRFVRPVVVPDDDAGAELSITGSLAERPGTTITIALDAVADGQKVLGAARVVLELAGSEHAS